MNALPARAYAMIYNEWFRDENLEAPLMLGYKKSDEGGTETNPGGSIGKTDGYVNNPKYTTNTNEASFYGGYPAKAGKFHDYFTSCLPSPLKNDPVEISLTGNAPVGLYKNQELNQFGTVNGNQEIFFNQEIISGNVPGIYNSLTGDRQSLVSGSSSKAKT